MAGTFNITSHGPIIDRRSFSRWDYIFSFIKKRRADRGAILPDRKDVTMTVPFMDAYVRLLIQTCHRYINLSGALTDV